MELQFNGKVYENFESNMNLVWINKVTGQRYSIQVLSLLHNLLIDFTELKLTVKRLCSFTKWSSIEMMDHNITSGHIIAMIIMHFLEFNSNFNSFVRFLSLFDISYSSALSLKLVCADFPENSPQQMISWLRIPLTYHHISSCYFNIYDT